MEVSIARHWHTWGSLVLLGATLAGYAVSLYGATMTIALLAGEMVLVLAWAHAETEALRRRRERLDLAIDASQTGIFDGDLLRGRLRWSKYHELLFGFREGGFDGTIETMRSRLHPDDRDAFITRVHKAKVQRAPYEIEFRVVWPDRSVHWLQARGRHLYDRLDRPARVMGTVIDISRRKQIERALDQALEQAAVASRAKSAFLANVSHELRTPLSIVLGFAEILVDSQPVDSVGRSHAERILRSGKHLLHIINDLLDLSQIEAGRLKVRAEPVDLRALIREVLELVQDQARAKQLSLHFEHIGESAPAIHTDPQRLRQILVNLIGNSIKFTERGSITIETRMTRGQAGRPQVAIQVGDTGIGIPKEIQPRIFEPFMQGESSPAKPQSGTGLGLYLSRRMAQTLGGNLVLSRSDGDGTAFTVTIDPEGVPPQAESDAGPASRDGASSPAPSPSPAPR